MNEFEKKLIRIAKGIGYPPTPDIAGFVSANMQPASRPRLMSRRFVWSLTILLILLSSLLLIPPARAAILEFIQVGIVRIFPARPETPTIAAPSLQSSRLTDFLDQIAGETNLANARELANYPILLPTYPPGFGQPDQVYVQDANGAMTILAWMDVEEPERVILSLHFIPQGSWMIEKVQPTVIQEAEVNGRRAVWTTGPYPLLLRNGSVEMVRLVEGHALIWEEGGITYRLETDQPLEEALKIAESLDPIP